DVAGRYAFESPRLRRAHPDSFHHELQCGTGGAADEACHAPFTFNFVPRAILDLDARGHNRAVQLSRALRFDFHPCQDVAARAVVEPCCRRRTHEDAIDDEPQRGTGGAVDEACHAPFTFSFALRTILDLDARGHN